QFQSNGCDIPLQTGCVSVGNMPGANTILPTTTFEIALSYDVPDNLGRFDIGYTNESGQLGEDGKRRSVFYSPEAQFYLALVAYFDGIYDKTAKALQRKNTPATGKNLTAALPRW